MEKVRYVHFWRKMAPFSKKGHVPQKFFSPFSRKMSFKKNIVRQKNIKNLISDKKGYIHFRR